VREHMKADPFAGAVTCILSALSDVFCLGDTSFGLPLSILVHVFLMRRKSHCAALTSLTRFTRGRPIRGAADRFEAAQTASSSRQGGRGRVGPVEKTEF
jgi:hypothetical protein